MKVVTRGAGPDLVLLHGWGMNGAIWGAFAARLAERYRLHLVDLPGHGRNRDVEGPWTPATLARAVAEHTPPAPWLGWSLGGLVAQCAARDLPGRVEALVVVAGTPCFVRRDHWPHAMAPELLDGFADALVDDVEATLNRFLVLETLGADDARETLRALRRAVLDGPLPRGESLRAGLAALRDTDLVVDLARLAPPSLWLGGTRDRLVPPQAVEAAAKACPRGRSRLIEGAGHAPFLTNPDACADDIAGWLKAVAEPSPSAADGIPGAMVDARA